MSNEYYEESWKRFRKSYDVKNKYHPIGKDSNFQTYIIPSKAWDEPMLAEYRKTINLEGKPTYEKSREDME